MKIIILICFIVFFNFCLIEKVNTFCMGMFCSYMPFMAKSCCSVAKKCCGHYQAWLSPLMSIDENSDDYLEALTHEVLHNNFGTSGYFDSDIHRYPGVFNNYNRFYKRHNRRSDNDVLDSNNLALKESQKLNKIENLQLAPTNNFLFPNPKNKDE